MNAPVADQFPRPLRPWELELLMLVIGTDDPGSAALRAQAASAVATDECVCGCGSIHLRVDPASPPASVGSPFPVEALAEIPNGRAVGAMLFIDDRGHMSLLELVWYTDEEPATMVRPPLAPWRRGRWVPGSHFQYDAEHSDAP